MASKIEVKTEPEEVQLSTSGGGVQPEGQPEIQQEEQVKEGEESFDLELTKNSWMSTVKRLNISNP